MDKGAVRKLPKTRLRNARLDGVQRIAVRRKSDHSGKMERLFADTRGVRSRSADVAATLGVSN
jgi:hypothetical protein